jgi:porin
MKMKMNGFKRYNGPHALLLGTTIAGLVSYAAILTSGDAYAYSQAADAQNQTDSQNPKKAQKVAKSKKARPLVPVAASPAIKIAPAPVLTGAQYDKVYGVHGWNIRFPSFGDSLLQDYGGWRTALAKAGFGFIAYDVTSFANNMLDTPRTVPAYSTVTATGAKSPYPNCSTTTSAICNGRTNYFGQRPAYYTFNWAYLTYDMSQWGVPDGQIVLSGFFARVSDQKFSPNTLQFHGLYWYQTLLDKKLEIQLGYFDNYYNFLGLYTGGNFASTFGASASVPLILGLGTNNAPGARLTYHMTPELYNTFSVQRSFPINGPTGSPGYDEAKSDPTGLRFTQPKGQALFIDEIGYKNAAAPGVPQTWARFGVEYNQSRFADLTRLTVPNSTIKSGSAVYFLLDRQLWQQDPSSPLTAYRGIYAGVTAAYAPPSISVFTQNYEARLYWLGPTATRPTDMISLIYKHNVISYDFSNAINKNTSPLAAQGFAVSQVFNATNSVNVSYLAHLRPGLYAQVGLGFTDHPAVTYFKNEGSSLNILASLTSVF